MCSQSNKALQPEFNDQRSQGKIKDDVLVFHKNILRLLNQMPLLYRLAVFHHQMFEELRKETSTPKDATHTVAIAALEASFKCMTAVIIVITTSGRYDCFSVPNV